MYVENDRIYIYRKKRERERKKKGEEISLIDNMPKKRSLEKVKIRMKRKVYIFQSSVF